MKHPDAVDAYQPVELAQRLAVALSGADVVSGSEQMAGIEAESYSIDIPYSLQDACQMLEAIADAAPLARGVFEHDRNRRPRSIQSAVQRFSDPHNARRFSRPFVGARMHHQQGDFQQLGSFHFFHQGIQRKAVQVRVRGSRVDEVGSVSNHRRDTARCASAPAERPVLDRKGPGFPLIAVLEEDLHRVASGARSPLIRQVDAAGNRHVSAEHQFAAHPLSSPVVIFRQKRGFEKIMAGQKILMVGLNATDRPLVAQYFTAAGHDVAESETISQACEHVGTQVIDVLYLQASSAAAAASELRKLRLASGDTPVVLIHNEPTAQTAIDAWREGAADLISPPLTPDVLDESLMRATRRYRGIPARTGSEVRARLRYVDVFEKEHSIPLTTPRFTIGRLADNDLSLTPMSVSRHHAEIRLENGEYILVDLDSKHGTEVNGVRIARAKLSEGDRIQIGTQHGQFLTFHQGDLLSSLLGSNEISSQSGFSIRGFREMGLLLSVLRSLSSIPLLDDLLSLVVDTAIEVANAERGFIMLKDSSGELAFRCARNNQKKPLDGTTFRTSRRVPTEVFETGRRKVISDLAISEQADHSSTRQIGVRSIACVPLRYWAFRESDSSSGTGKMEIIGVLHIDSPNAARPLSDAQVDALEALATEAAMAINNARLYKEAQEKRKMDEELAIAREIQQSLLPDPQKTLPFVRACSQNLPCREVGGDYFDYFDLEGGRLGFALGDVAGKGMPAALLMSMLRGIFSGQALMNLPPDQLLTNVNLSLVKRGPGNRFVTLFFGILDPDGTCTYTNAGHNPPLLVGRDGSIRRLTEGGLVLGLFPQATYKRESLRLQSGEHLVLFTDGVLEALNREGEEFGEERLCGLLQAHRRAKAPLILKQIEEAVARFSVDTPQHDDITMMVLGFRED